MFTLQSSAFGNTEIIPTKFTEMGENISPPLEWSGVSPRARELALICEDLDAPGGEPIVHWMIYHLDPKSPGLPEGIAPNPEVYKPLRARQGLNTLAQAGYFGPTPPVVDDWHTYQFKLYALDHHSNLRAGAGRNEFYDAIEDHIIAASELIGIYRSTSRHFKDRPESNPEART